MLPRSCARQRAFPVDKVRLTHIFRGIAAVLAVVLLGNSVAFAAGTALDPVKLKQKLTTRGIGNSVKVMELDGTTVSGNIAAINDDNFQVSVKQAAQPVTISYAQVFKEGNGGLSVGAKIGIAVGCVVVVAAVIAIVVASKLKGGGGGPGITL